MIIESVQFSMNQVWAYNAVLNMSGNGYALQVSYELWVMIYEFWIMQIILPPPIFLDFAISTCQNEDICVVAVVWTTTHPVR